MGFTKKVWSKRRFPIQVGHPSEVSSLDGSSTCPPEAASRQIENRIAKK
jgi:hypothetical protein